jgi:RimJ/RimL family protein N-acetyltransferase
MGKYDKLRDYLRAQRISEMVMTFRQIEDIVGAPLPNSAVRPQWWENERNPHTTRPQRIAWRDAGYVPS